MACNRGKANPDSNTQKRLFASSGGYCQNPSCNQPLFVETGTKNVSIAEMAHIFAAQDDGPRPNPMLTKEERGAFSNLILLCTNCHTIIDKASQDFPDKMIRTWKSEHEARIAGVFGAVLYGTRSEALEALKTLMARTGAIHRRIGPNNEYKWNPEADEAIEWRHHMIQTIIPTNRIILALLDRNRSLLTEIESEVLEDFRNHLEGLEQRHIFNSPLVTSPKYPEGMKSLLKFGVEQ